MLPAPSHFVRVGMVTAIRDIFNDRARGETPVNRSTNSFYSPTSVIWRVHGDVTSMMIGGVAALLLQMLHPAALAGIWDHSAFKADMLGRLRRTARFIAITTFGDRREADQVIATVRDVHERVRGTLPSGDSYSASDPRLLAWVHVAEAISFLDAWIRYGEPRMTGADQDQYFLEFAEIARALGAEPVPTTRGEAEALIASFRAELRCDERTRSVADNVLHQRAPVAALAPMQALIMRAAVDLLPDWARRQHRLSQLSVGVPLLRSATATMASTLRWAFAGISRPRN